MSLGRTRSVKTPKIVAPPRITSQEFTMPTGDRYLTQRNGNKETSNSILSPLTGRTVDTSQAALSELAGEIRNPDARRIQDIALRGQDFYDLQANVINSEADSLFGKAASDISKRFGGTYNATFGTDLLAQLEGNRLSQLSGAAKEARLLAEDLYSRDEDSRMSRFNMFQGFLAGLNNEAMQAGSMGSDLLMNESNRAQDLAISRTRMVQDAQRYNQLTDLQKRQQRLDVMKVIAGTATDVAKIAAGGGG